MPDFHTLYHPITSRPFLSSRSYKEYRPCQELRPYVSCYWTSDRALAGDNQPEVLVIPDTCMDIIVEIDEVQGTVSGYLCGIQDGPFLSSSDGSEEYTYTFAIRFYFWSASLFMDLDFKHTGNRVLELAALGREWQAMLKMLVHIRDRQNQILWAESFLLERLGKAAVNPGLFNSVDRILKSSGRETVKEICAYSCISQRQMERMFLQEIGLPLKRVSNMVRYQNVWKDMVLSPHFHIQDAVYRYGYTDQAHLLKEFKRFHGRLPQEARRIAFSSK